MAERGERNGVRLGQRVRDLDGRELGRVRRFHAQTFEVVKGFPVLFRRTAVIGFDEVRGEEPDGRLVVSRSERGLFELAAGELPRTWLIPGPPDFPHAATPPEARGVFDAFAGRPLTPAHQP